MKPLFTTDSFVYFPLFNLISNVISLCKPTLVFVRQKYHHSLSLSLSWDWDWDCLLYIPYLYSTFASITNLILDFSLSLDYIASLFLLLSLFFFFHSKNHTQNKVLTASLILSFRSWILLVDNLR